MVLIDSLHINNAGGKVLLDYLIASLELQQLEITYLLDERVKNNHPVIKKTNSIIYLKAGVRERHRFYRQHKDRFSTVICFANLPPTVRLKATVFTYFHQQLYLKMPKENSTRFKATFFLKRLLLKKLLRNTDVWLMQSAEIKNNFSEKFNISKDTIKVFPFYPSLEKTELPKEKNSYLYVSNSPAHKNHFRLINAFCSFYDKHKLGKLTLTVGRIFPELISLIQEKQAAGYPIVNVGFVARQQLSKIYQQAEYLVYPSLTESFGLGLIEGIEAGCKVIGADLPYTYAVCEPSLTFNPLDEDSISAAFALSLRKNIKPAVLKVPDKMEELISLLTYHENSK